MSLKVTIDAGHGGNDPGAVNKELGLHEADICLSVAKLVYGKLRSVRGVKPLLTREDDTFLTLSERPAIANEFGSNIFISIHCNAAERKSARGFEIFTTRGQNNSDKLATSIGNEIITDFPDLKQRFDYSDGDLDKEANYAVIRKTNHPSCLIELEFISNYAAAKLLNDRAYQNTVADAIVRGILKFAGIKAQVTPDKPAPTNLTIEERIAKLEKNQREIAKRFNIDLE